MKKLSMRGEMGLDIYHLKIVTGKIKKKDYILLKELSEDMVKLYGFNKYITRDRVEGIFSLVALLNTNDDLSMSDQYLDSIEDAYTEYKLKIAGTPESAGTELARFEELEGLTGFKRHRFDATIHIDGRTIEYADIAYEGELLQDVLYVEEAGYQRKGMNEEFFSHFQNDTYYADKSSFEKLLQFSDPEHHMYNPENIISNFIEKYEYGKSLLSLSW